ncbi:hypothetical protein COLO4_15691 [Corchorus olitorius]|uniref:Uncharacterized protein n=1 Tax=Corchorus olitorius TaxID=93759 RepID=A0A1R3JLQ7_9ROSI|nr:hypothetical protein COLO4_15691 [Corchorus olitorius]
MAGFPTLVQGDMLVSEYEAKLKQLARRAPDLERNDVFMSLRLCSGLNLDIQKNMADAFTRDVSYRHCIDRVKYSEHIIEQTHESKSVDIESSENIR